MKHWQEVLTFEYLFSSQFELSDGGHIFSFSDEEDMTQNCPGPTRDEHDDD